MPLPRLSATLGPTGISAPSYTEILQSLQESFQAIYGSDVYIAADSQDGQLLAIMAKAIADNNDALVSVYNGYSPTYAQGVGLSNQVKINGIRRQSPSFSTAVGNVVGVAGTIIINGVVADENNNLWNLPASVTIPPGGLIVVSVTAQQPGAISAPTGTINTINSPVFGWQEFISTTDAATGNPVETDAALRRRQAQSTAISSETPLQGVYAAIADLDGVQRVAAYENFTGVVDINGLPPHSISLVVLGGDPTEIATVIGQKKTPGAATYGATTTNYTDPVTGITYAIHFFELTQISIEVSITGAAGIGWSSAIADKIKQQVAAYLNGLDIGVDVQYTRMFSPAYLNGSAEGQTYEISALSINKSGDAPGVVDLPIAFNAASVCDPDTDITVAIT